MIAKPLKKISNMEFLHDVKTYIKNTHGFYINKVPEMKVMAKKFHEEYSLKDFYKIFNRLWNSGANGERSLAIHTLELYREDFDVKTWDFLRGKLRDIKSFNEAECMGKIVSFVYAKNTLLKKEIIALSEQNNIWMRRISLLSCYYILKKNSKDILFMMPIIENNTYDKDQMVKKIIVSMLNQIGKTKKELLKKFILKHKDMPEDVFLAVTKNMKYLRNLRGLKKLNNVRILS